MMTPIGYRSRFQYEDLQLELAATDQGLCLIAFPNELPDSIEKFLKQHFSKTQWEPNEEKMAPYVEQLTEYFQGIRREFTFPLDMRGTEFQISVWQALASIPYSQIRSYQEIAIQIGKPQALRAVGTANGRNPLPIVVPCHRVIGKNGTLTGFRGGMRLKERLLNLEGIKQYQASGHLRFNF